MTAPTKLNEFNRAEDPARRLLEGVWWIYVPRDGLAAECADEREVLLNRRLLAALPRLNDLLTEDQAIFELENVNATSMTSSRILLWVRMFSLI